MGRDYNREMLSFIESSPSCFHAVENLRRRLLEKGFEELKEGGEWKVSGGGDYFVSRNDSALVAFRLPQGQAGGFHMAASHSDSPTFKVKEQPETGTDKHYVRLNTERYGGMILSTWLDRPLSVAGRVAVRKDGGIVSRLVNLDRDLLVIPNLAIHMNREMNKGVEYNPQVDLLPLYAEYPVCAGQAGKEGEDRSREEGMEGMLLREIAKSLGVDEKDILGQDLFLYVRDRGRILGRDGEFVLSPRLDDLQCVFASMEAFLDVRPREYIALCAVFDNEEVGSGTRQGADSTFLEDVIVRVCESMGRLCDMRRMLADSFLISADNAHAVHPNHPDMADPTNRPYLNGGIVIKYHGSQKYTTDALSGARMKDWCIRAGVPFQTYANRSDIPGGSTLGNISAAHVSVPSVDIGLAQLAMHSAVETAGSRDTEAMVRVLGTFFAE